MTGKFNIADDQANREAFITYLHEKCGEPLGKAQAYVARLKPSEVGRAFGDRVAKEGLMAYLGVGARSALEGKE